MKLGFVVNDIDDLIYTLEQVRDEYKNLKEEFDDLNNVLTHSRDFSHG